MNRTWTIIIAAALVVVAVIFIWGGWDSQIDSPDTAPPAAEMGVPGNAEPPSPPGPVPADSPTPP